MTRFESLGRRGEKPGGATTDYQYRTRTRTHAAQWPGLPRRNVPDPNCCVTSLHSAPSFKHLVWDLDASMNLWLLAKERYREIWLE